MFSSWKIEKLEKELGVDYYSSYICRPLLHNKIKNKEYLRRLQKIKECNFPEYISFPGICRFNILEIDLNLIKEEIEEENKYREILYNQVFDFIEGVSEINSIDYNLFEKCEKKFILSIIALVEYFEDKKLPRFLKYEYYNLEDHKFYTNNYLLNELDVTEDMIQATTARLKDFLVLTKRPDYPIYSSSFEHCCEVFLLLKKSEFNIPDTIKLSNDSELDDDYIEEYNIIKAGNSFNSYINWNGKLDPDTKKSLDRYINLAINNWKI